MYAPAASLPALIFGLDLRPGAVAVVVVDEPSVPGLQWIADDGRAHYASKDHRLHYASNDWRPHYKGQ